MTPIFLKCKRIMRKTSWSVCPFQWNACGESSPTNRTGWQGLWILILLSRRLDLSDSVTALTSHCHLCRCPGLSPRNRHGNEHHPSRAKLSYAFCEAHRSKHYDHHAKGYGGATSDVEQTYPRGYQLLLSHRRNCRHGATELSISSLENEIKNAEDARGGRAIVSSAEYQENLQAI